MRIARQEDGESWINALPGLAAERAEAWSLHGLGEPFADSSVSLVLPAELPDGRAVVLKLQFPHRESEREAEALQHWSGDGAVQLFAHDHSRSALLIERCLPGVHLSTEEQDEVISVLTALLPRLWKPAGEPFTTLSEEAALWRRELADRWEAAGRSFERRLLDAASEALRDLADTQGEQVLIHQDLHGDNVLAAEREQWLAIDPKPVVGEREFAVAPVVRSYEFGHSRGAVWRRLDRLSSELGLDRERARLWSFAQTLAWAFEGTSVLPRHVETARWLLT
ncbi:MAG TPA: aminoglycoside phosphotransferase family protein [Acidimicrobiia bacterium]|nr:aminoglycoside phosphotransferase family protein [Acidimicrobiia bacterium]